MKVAIVGAGILGLTAAYELVKKNHNVTVFEKENEIGGLTEDFSCDNWHLEKFYHHLFQTDKEVIRLIKEVGLEKSLLWVKPETSVLYGGKIHSLDSPLDVLLFSALNIMDRLKLGLEMLYLKMQPNHKVFQGQTAVFWLRKHLGDSTYQVLWEPLLKSKFGAYHDKIAMSWFWARIHYRTATLGYLKGGFYQLYNRLRDQIVALGGEFVYQASVSEITSSGKQPTLKVREKVYRFDKIIVTVPTPLFHKITQGLPKDYVEKYCGVNYYGAQTLVLLTGRKVLPVYWLNINDSGLPFLAYVEHTNFMSPLDYNGDHLIYLGNYFSADDPRSKKSEKEVVNESLEALRKLNPDFSPGWVKKSWLFRTPYAQPIVDVDYEKNIPPLETPLKNVYLANMAQVYPQDRGQNYCITRAKKVVELI